MNERRQQNIVDADRWAFGGRKLYAASGWHRDRPQFGDVIGISLLAPCTFRLRRKCGATWQRRSIIAAPRSAYLLRGPSRTEWEHSISPLATLRYSITFRTLTHRASPR